MYCICLEVSQFSKKLGKHARFLGLRAVHASHHARMRIAIENMRISSKYESHF